MPGGRRGARPARWARQGRPRAARARRSPSRSPRPRCCLPPASEEKFSLATIQVQVRGQGYHRWAMAATADLDREYAVLTESCGVVDRSERGKLALTGADRKAFLNGQVTNEIETLAEGEGCYAAFLTPKGKMLGDLRVLDAADELLLATERVALQALFDMIRRYSLGHQVELHKRTVESGLLSLVGPRAREVAGA